MKSQTNLKGNTTLSTSRLNQKLSQEQIQKKFEQLYNQNEKWAAKKDKMRHERDLAKSLEDLKQCTFKPTVNPQTAYDGSNGGSFLRRQMDWLNKKEKKIQQMTRQTEKQKKKQCSFHPTISRKTYNMMGNPQRCDFYQSDGPQTNSNQKSCNNSYRNIHMKKQTLKKLLKTSSMYSFNLMTEMRNQNRTQYDNKKYTNGINLQSRFQKSFQTPQKHLSHSKKTKTSRHLGYQQDYIQNVVIKTQQQDTFNSLSSLQLKTDRKQHHQSQTQSQIKIFEESLEQQEDSVEQNTEIQPNTCQKQDKILESECEANALNEEIIIQKEIVTQGKLE